MYNVQWSLNFKMKALDGYVQYNLIVTELIFVTNILKGNMAVKGCIWIHIHDVCTSNH